MNVRNITIALIALLLVLIIGSAVVVREVAPRLANNSTGAVSTFAKAMNEQIAPAGGRERAVRSTRSGRDPEALRPFVRRPASLVGRLVPLALGDERVDSP